MRCLVVVGALLLESLFARGAEKPENKLTTEETANGWMLLFDGQTRPRWQMDGDCAVEDGTLALTGSGTVRALPTIRLSDDFELEFEYYLTGNGPAYLRFEGQRDFLKDPNTAEGDLPTVDNWVRVHLEGHNSPVSGYSMKPRHYLVATGEQLPSRVTYMGRGSMEVFWFEIPAGAKLYLRNVKLQGGTKPSSNAPLVISGVIVAVIIGAGGIFFMLRYWRKAVADTTLPQRLN
jgi:hypothetical protein